MFLLVGGDPRLLRPASAWITRNTGTEVVVVASEREARALIDGDQRIRAVVVHSALPSNPGGDACLRLVQHLLLRRPTVLVAVTTPYKDTTISERASNLGLDCFCMLESDCDAITRWAKAVVRAAEARDPWVARAIGVAAFERGLSDTHVMIIVHAFDSVDPTAKELATRLGKTDIAIKIHFKRIVKAFGAASFRAVLAWIQKAALDFASAAEERARLALLARVPS